MVGNPAIPVVADVVLKGFGGFDRAKAYEAMKSSAMRDDRRLDLYKRYGYIPYDFNESVGYCLEYAIADWAVAQAAGSAKANGRITTISSTAARPTAIFRSLNPVYARAGFDIGASRTPFNPFALAPLEQDYTEGNAWQYTWLVPHDIEGLMECFGGRERFVGKLDSLFLAEGDMGAHASPDISGLIGQYAHGNEPSHHITYIYTMIGQPWKCAEKVRRILGELYHDRPEGLCGNEDVGQMSAWYVLSALGMYQAEPAGGRYFFGSPAVDGATLRVRGGEFRITAADNSPENIYIQRIRLNGEAYAETLHRLRGDRRRRGTPLRNGSRTRRLDKTATPMKRLLLLMACAAAAACSADWRDTSLPPQKRAELLTAEMTLDEKIGQLTSPYGWEMYERHGDSVRLTDAFREAVQNGHIGMLWGTFRADPWTQKDLRTGLTPQLAARLANRMQRYAVQHSRLGIPLFLAEEAPHGHMAIGATTFPTAPGQASTWNPELIERMGKVIAAEIRLQGGHICYGPVLDIVRDPRWSRTEESYGEDCYLTARIGEAYVRGTGSGDLSQSRHALSTLKHFIAYGASEGGQNGGSNLLGERELRETYLPPFEAAVKAGARSVMTAYNSVDGIPCTANRRMLTDILRGEWGFDGFVVSDLLSIEGLHETHGVAGSVREAAVQALRAGVDADLKGGAFASLREAAEAGDVAEAEIDRAVERVLALKFEMGLFENPYIDEAAAAEVGCAAHSELALEAARQSVTLLENRSGTLPLDPRRLRRVAVIGPNADNIYNQLGDYTAQQTAANTVRDGLEKLLGRDRVVYSRGCTVRGGDRSEIAAAVSAARGTDAAVVVIGGSSARDFDTEFLQTGAAKAAHDEVRDMECGEGFDRATLALLGEQEELLRRIKATGTPLIVVCIAGRPLDLRRASEQADALLMAWYPGARGGDAVAETILGRNNPAGRLPITIPRAEGQIPVYYNKKRPANHDYTDLTAAPLYPFGYGLSYSTFEYGSLEARQSGDNVLEVSCRIRNTSDREGDEVVQLYISDMVASTVRPPRQLGGFRRIRLAPGEQRQVSFTLGDEALALIDPQGRRVVEKGDFVIAVGSSSQDIRLQTTVTLE